MELNINGIAFTNVKTGGIKISSNPINVNGLSSTDPDDGSGILNIVNIDWNGAIIPNGDLANGTSKTINTTGELLSLINEMQQEIYVLSAAVVALSNNTSSSVD